MRISPANVTGLSLAALLCMKAPSPAREKTLALQRRALTFRKGVNLARPQRFTNIPSETIWRQLVRAADSVSNSLTEAGEAVSGPAFVQKIKLTLRETRESRTCLEKIRVSKLDRFEAVAKLEREAGELCALFATISVQIANPSECERQAPKASTDTDAC